MPMTHPSKQCRRRSVTFNPTVGIFVYESPQHVEQDHAGVCEGLPEWMLQTDGRRGGGGGVKFTSPASEDSRNNNVEMSKAKQFTWQSALTTARKILDENPNVKEGNHNAFQTAKELLSKVHEVRARPAAANR